MNILKATGLAAVAGLLLFAAPGQRAEAASMQSPGIAAAVQQGAIAGTTEVRWHRGWRRHHGWHRHYGWRRHHGWHRRHWHRRHWR